MYNVLRYKIEEHKQCTNMYGDYDSVCFSHFQSQSSASWGGRVRHWHGLWWCQCYCYNSSGDAGTGQHTALSPPQTAALETKHTLSLKLHHKTSYFIIKGTTFKAKRVIAKQNRTDQQKLNWAQLKNLFFDLISLLTFDTRALCVAKQCCKYSALWLHAMLWSRTFRTPPRMLSLDSVTDTVCMAHRGTIIVKKIKVF